MLLLFHLENFLGQLKDLTFVGLIGILKTGLIDFPLIKVPLQVENGRLHLHHFTLRVEVFICSISDYLLYISCHQLFMLH